ncbi:MAG: LexA family transcriptional regulator [Fimbriimonadaceae bacterium]|nr:LexA family transcriptional regulator [Chitinophagales bacterium]
MNHLAKNLKHLRSKRKISQQELADMLSVGRTAVANIEANLANPGHKTLLEIVRIFDISLDELLHRDLSKQLKEVATRDIEKGSGTIIYRPLVITVDDAGEENIVMVDTKAAAGYPTRFLEPEFYKELPAFKLPGTDYRNGTFRCFQIDGDSMQDSLQHGDYVIARFCDDHYKDIREGYIHVVVTNDNVLVKRVINKIDTDGKMYLLSDNDAYPEIAVDADNIKELWYVKSKLSTYMPVKKNDLDKLVGDLTMQLQVLKNRLDNIERN